jgi:hypothetical protein
MEDGPGTIDEHGARRRGSLTVAMSTIQDIDREAARRVARVLGEDADAEAPGSDEGSGDAVPSPSSQHAATMDQARTKATHTSRVVGRAWPYVPRILALAAVVAAISGLLQIAGNSKHGRNRTGSLGQSGQVNDPEGVPGMKNTIQRQAMSAAVTAAVGAAASAQQAVQWRVEDGGNGYWYAGIVQDGCSWTGARQTAVSMGGDLVSLGTEAESTWVYSRIASLPGLWRNRVGPRIGLVQDPDGQEPNGGWRWADGTPLTFVNWNLDGFHGQPNPVEGVECAGSDFGGYYGWPQMPMNSWGSYRNDHFSSVTGRAFGRSSSNGPAIATTTGSSTTVRFSPAT